MLRDVVGFDLFKREFIGQARCAPHPYVERGVNDTRLGECRTLWGEREQAMHYSIDRYVAACLALSASLRLDKRSSFCSAVSAEWEGVVAIAY